MLWMHGKHGVRKARYTLPCICDTNILLNSCAIDYQFITRSFHLFRCYFQSQSSFIDQYINDVILKHLILLCDMHGVASVLNQMLNIVFRFILSMWNLAENEYKDDTMFPTTDLTAASFQKFLWWVVLLDMETSPCSGRGRWWQYSALHCGLIAFQEELTMTVWHLYHYELSQYLLDTGCYSTIYHTLVEVFI